MLQQTQVERVVPFYGRFVKQFPSAAALSRAPLSKVLRAWSGLGYNRRAIYLQQSAKLLSSTETSFEKVLGSPVSRSKRSRVRLFSQEISAPHLPGVGPYTAAAVEAFGYNKPTVFIETNIRTVFLHYCFPHKTTVADKEILPLVEKALKKSQMQPREFYARLMDLGAQLKKRGTKLNSRSVHYVKQSKFEGSYRQLRGQILRVLLTKPATLVEIIRVTGRKKSDVIRTLASMTKEGTVELKRSRFSIAD